MRREDWLWLSIKVAGLWLIVTAVETATLHSWFTASPSEAYAAGREQILRIALPLVSGLCLLLIDFARWLPVEPSGSSEQPGAPEPTAARSLSRSDWLWVGLKMIGAYYAMAVVYFVGQFWSMTGRPVSDLVSALSGPALGLAASLWLLLGNRVWRAASREPGASGAASVQSRAGDHLRDLLVVVIVFAVLGSLPVLLLWWVAAE